MSSKIVIAGAGSGKSRYLIESVDSISDGKLLITTFTNANEESLKSRLYKKYGCIPSHVTVMSWWAFLLEHCVRPFQGCYLNRRISQLNLVNGQSGVKYRRGRTPIFFNENKEFVKHYFDNNGCIYSDKISKFAFRCHEKSSGALLGRLSRCFQYIFIDEVQDMSGYDLNLIKIFHCSKINILMVGDLRQGTYSTTNLSKNKNYAKSKIVQYFKKETPDILIDDTSLIYNHRSVDDIVNYSNSLYPSLVKNISKNKSTTGHDGVFFVSRKTAASYIERYAPLQLRLNKRTVLLSVGEHMTFGKSKGLETDRVLIYPTKPMLEWIKDNESELADKSRAEFYVAITRARQSVAFVVDDRALSSLENAKVIDKVTEGLFKLKRLSQQS
ncbi:DNA helicase II / ATP-dependent DNA helicase PcrA [Halobacteriovorax sp. BALOs_7]|uniref:UvrD-helicase domain-containing protein n=1 Tax=Halobacteriovorax sp. BALOs_7 TaxID=2109558 RepID=UPI000EB749A9|nr:UvrD-helicase domain-containing protein [Halobacteriovorax sp. BALOs_7]AYF45216.1 DNA helicase II / ATP-dependent DNA helicase PcrA [Halobacteriovorax sp. BALOs_7]